MADAAEGGEVGAAFLLERWRRVAWREGMRRVVINQKKKARKFALAQAKARAHLLKQGGVLLKAGGDIHQVITTGGMSPLYIASQNGNIDIVKILIEAGGDVHQVSNDGYTVLGASSHEGHLEIVRLLRNFPKLQLKKILHKKKKI